MADQEFIKKSSSASCDLEVKCKKVGESSTSDKCIHAEINVHFDTKSSRRFTSVKDAVTTSFERVSQPAENSEEGENQNEVLVDKHSIIIDMKKAILLRGKISGKYKNYLLVSCDDKTAAVVKSLSTTSIRIIDPAEEKDTKVLNAALLVENYDKSQGKRDDADPIRGALEHRVGEVFESFLNDKSHHFESHSYSSVKYNEHVYFCNL